VAGAACRIDSTLGGTTDRQGRLEIGGAPFGRQSILVTAVGHATTRYVVDLDSLNTDGPTAHAFVLRLPRSDGMLRLEVLGADGRPVPRATVRLDRWITAPAPDVAETVIEWPALPHDLTTEAGGTATLSGLPRVGVGITVVPIDLDEDGVADLQPGDAMDVDLARADTTYCSIRLRPVPDEAPIVRATNVPDTTSVGDCFLYWEFARNMDTTTVNSRLDLVRVRDLGAEPVQLRWVSRTRLEARVAESLGEEYRAYLEVHTALGSMVMRNMGPFRWTPPGDCGE